MSFDNFPTSVKGLETHLWQTYEPYVEDLKSRDISGENLLPWLHDWSRLSELITEAGALIYIAKTIDTTDEVAEQRYLDFIHNVQPKSAIADQVLKERFLATDPSADDLPDLALVIRHMRNQADLFREENVPLQTELAKLSNTYDKITGAMSADWEGEQKNLSQLKVLLLEKDRSVRERAWRQIHDLWLANRQQLNQLFGDMLALRRQVAQNAELPDYRAYVFREYDRFDYTPDDCFLFHEAIEEAVVPLAAEIYERRRNRLGLAALRPWDVEVDTSGYPPLKPYHGQDELVQHTLNIFQHVDPILARNYAIMAEENLLDLDTRSGKALGGYCSTLPMRRQPFIFMNGVGTNEDVHTMLHEAGHAFHVFEAADLTYAWQLESPMEFAEVASMSMELVAAPYLSAKYGGFYSDSEAARARIEQLENIVLFLPYMAVVDAFQHWVYTNPEQAANADECDRVWDELWDRFMPEIDYDGLENERVSGWHRKLHIFQVPFYYIEYGMAQVGAFQVWRNAQRDQEAAVAAYRQALSKGGTVELPELFETAGAEFRFDTPLLAELMALVESEIKRLEMQV